MSTQAINDEKPTFMSLLAMKVYHQKKYKMKSRIQAFVKPFLNLLKPCQTVNMKGGVVNSDTTFIGPLSNW
jgi:hypothetical protein